MVNRIREIRKLKGMTLRELGCKIGVSHQCINNYEAGRRNVDLQIAARIAEALGCTVDELITKETA